MEVALLGARGFVGSALLDEALLRGHTVTAIARHPEKLGLATDSRVSQGTVAAALGGLETLVFSAGIGEGSATIRARICEGLDFLGIEVHDERNAPHAAVISTNASRVTVRVMRTDEERMIALGVTSAFPQRTHHGK